MTACSNDFLHDETDGYLYDEKIYIENVSGPISENLTLGGVGNASYKIKAFPNWIEFKSFEGNIVNDKLELSFNVIKQPDSFVGNIDDSYIALDVKGLGIMVINVVLVNNGNSVLEVKSKSIYFSKGSKEQIITIQNKGNGLLAWEVTYKPSWVNLLEVKGEISNHGFYDLYAFCNREGLDLGEYKDSIVIKNKRKKGDSISIDVRMVIGDLTNPENIHPISGIVVGAEYSKTLDKLYVLTRQPDMLSVYDTKNSSWSNVTLPKNPNCISLSENGKQAFIGYSGLMSVVDLVNESVTKNINLDFSAFSIAYGENNWCYLSCQTSDYYGYFSLNLESGIATETFSSHVYYNSNIIKIKNKPLLLASRTEVSPSGVILLDLSDGVGRDLSYWHDSKGEKIWLTEDGTIMVGNYYGIVCRTPDENTGSVIHEFGSLTDYYLNWVDHNQDKKVFWTVPSKSYYSNERYVNSYDDANYKLTKSIMPEEYVTTINGEKNFYDILPYYVFTNKNGTALHIIRNLLPSYKVDAWSLEVKQIN